MNYYFLHKYKLLISQKKKKNVSPNLQSDNYIPLAMSFTSITWETVQVYPSARTQYYNSIIIRATLERSQKSCRQHLAIPVVSNSSNFIQNSRERKRENAPANSLRRFAGVAKFTGIIPQGQQKRAKNIPGEKEKRKGEVSKHRLESLYDNTMSRDSRSSLFSFFFLSTLYLRCGGLLV